MKPNQASANNNHPNCQTLSSLYCTCPVRGASAPGDGNYRTVQFIGMYNSLNKQQRNESELPDSILWVSNGWKQSERSHENQIHLKSAQFGSHFFITRSKVYFLKVILSSKLGILVTFHPKFIITKFVKKSFWQEIQKIF